MGEKWRRTMVTVKASTRIFGGIWYSHVFATPQVFDELALDYDSFQKK
jgi:hypothetical protein